MARGTWGPGGDNNLFGVRISWMQGTSTMQTGFKLRGATLTTEDADEIADAVEGWVNTSFRTILLLADRVQGIDVVNLVSREGASRSPANMTGAISMAASGRAPSYIAAVVSMKGELRTRYGQGRMFWPVRSEDFSDEEQLNAAGLAAFQGVIDDLTELFTGNTVTGYNLVNAHGIIPAKAATPTSPQRPEVPASWADVTSLRLNRNTTFLRSRKAGVGS